MSMARTLWPPLRFFSAGGALDIASSGGIFRSSVAGDPVSEPRPDIVSIIAKHQRRPPVDIAGMIEDAGIALRSESLGLEVSGRIFADRSSAAGYTIVVNSDHDHYRQRFTMAFEFAHYLLHTHIIDRDGSLIDDASYRCGALSEQEIRDANHAAANLLMPRSMVDALLDRYPLDEAAKILQVRSGALEKWTGRKAPAEVSA